MPAPDILSLRRVARAIANTPSAADAAREAARALVEVVGARRALVLIDPSIVAEAVADGAGASVTLRRAAVRDPEAMPLSILSSVEPAGLVVHDASSQSRFQADPYVARERPRAVIAAPLSGGSTPLGIAYAESDREGAFEAGHLEAVLLVSELCAASIAQSKRLEASAAALEEAKRALARAEALCDDAKQRLSAQERLASLGTIASGVAHEIKNPLHFVNNFAEISVGLAADLGVELERHQALFAPESAAYLREIVSDLAQNIGRIDEHGRRAGAIVKGMLQHVRGRMAQRVEVDFNALVRDYATSAAEAQLGPTGVGTALALSLDPAAGRASLVPEELGRVVLNLVSNGLHAARAAKAARGDGFAPEVRVSTRSLGDQVEVRVRDNGGGIPAAIRDRVYQPFFTTKPPGEGTGLGLPLSREIVVDKHGGEIAFETEEGDHTEFVVTLPRRGPASPPPHEDAAGGPKPQRA